MSVLTVPLRTCVSRLSRVRHQRVLVQLSCLIIRRFQNCRASHGSLRRCQKDKVLASDAEKDLPAGSPLAGSIDYQGSPDTHISAVIESERSVQDKKQE